MQASRSLSRLPWTATIKLSPSTTDNTFAPTRLTE